MTTIAFVGIGPRSKCPQAQLRLDELSKRCRRCDGRAAVKLSQALARRKVRLVARRFRLPEAPAVRRRRHRRDNGLGAGPEASEGCPRGPQLTSCSVEALLMIAGKVVGGGKT